MKNFEQKIDKSKELLEKLMNPEITLSESMKIYKEGMNELKEANELLQKAKIEFEEFQEDDKKDQEI